VVDIGQETLGARSGYCRGHSAALTNEPLYGAQQSVLCLQPSDETTSETTSHPARLSKDDSLVIGYRQAVKASQVAGYAFR
jgi:hypothetical protein